MNNVSSSGEDVVECPLCMEPLEIDDLHFFPCTCGYQICRFCWHRIRTDENELCPACRKEYPENPADFTPPTQEEIVAHKSQKRQRDQQRKQKITENRKHLANVRVVQKNLVFVVGLPPRLADADILKKHEYFGKFGKIHKVVINPSTTYAGVQGPSASAYVTYINNSDALRAIQSVNNIMIDGRLIKTSLGTTKYCSHFMKNQQCPKSDCMYLHELGDSEASFTKEEMHQGKHQEYEKRLHDTLNASANNLGVPANTTTNGTNAVTTTTNKNGEIKANNSNAPFSSSLHVITSSATSALSSAPTSAGVSQKDAWPSLSESPVCNKEIQINSINSKHKKDKLKSEKVKNEKAKTKKLGNSSQPASFQNSNANNIKNNAARSQNNAKESFSSENDSSSSKENVNATNKVKTEKNKEKQHSSVQLNNKPTANEEKATDSATIDADNKDSRQNSSERTSTTEKYNDEVINNASISNPNDVRSFDDVNAYDSSLHIEESRTAGTSENDESDTKSFLPSNNDNNHQAHASSESNGGDFELNIIVNENVRITNNMGLTSSANTNSEIMQQQQQTVINDTAEKLAKIDIFDGNSSFFTSPTAAQQNNLKNKFESDFPHFQHNQTNLIHSHLPDLLNDVSIINNSYYNSNFGQNYLPLDQYKRSLTEQQEAENSLFPPNMSKFFDFHKNQQQQQQQQHHLQQFMLNGAVGSGNLNLSDQLRIATMLENNLVNSQYTDATNNTMLQQSKQMQKQRLMSKMDPIGSQQQQHKMSQNNMSSHQQQIQQNGITNQFTSDDDLGFDPFTETQKALAELMEHEGVSQQKSNSGTSSRLNVENSILQHQQQTQSQQQQQQHLLPNQHLYDNFQRARMPPPGFSHMNAFSFGLPRTQNNSKTAPFVNIANNGPTSNGQSMQQQHMAMNSAWNPMLTSFNQNPMNDVSLMQLNQNQSNGNNLKAYDNNDWTTMDPAILSFRQYSSVPQQTQMSNHLQQQQQEMFLHLPHQQNMQNFVPQSTMHAGSSLTNSLQQTAQAAQAQLDYFKARQFYKMEL